MFYKLRHSQMAKYTALILSILLLAALCGCSLIQSIFQTADTESFAEHVEDTASAGMRRTTLYFQTDEGVMVPVMKLMPWEEGIGRAALNQLVNTDENRLNASAMGLRNVVPQGVTFVLSISDDAIATVDIQNLPKLENVEMEQALVCAVVNTLTEFPTIDQVQLKFDGKQLKKLPHGTDVRSAMRTIPLNEEPLPVNASKDDSLHKMTLYFANNPASLYVPVTRTVTREPSLALAMEELVIGPVDSALRNCFPEGTQVLSASMLDDVACVNFSSEFNALSNNSILEEIAIETIKLTAQQFGVIAATHIQVEGSDYKPSKADNEAMPTFANTFR